MRLFYLLISALALVLPRASASLYPKGSMVKMVDTRGFRSALKENRTILTAFVASWCGHCKAMVPEYSKAALGLHPLIPLYAVDCDENRSLCAEQGVKGFPTVKLFPRGKEQAPILFEHPDRSASAFFYFATRRVPHKNKKLYTVEDIEPWANDKIAHTRVLLLSKAKDIPLMWKVLANKYRDDFAFANHRDRKGKSSEALGYDAGSQKESKILVYPEGSAKPSLFEGVLKYNSISNFFNSILDGTANLTVQHSQMPEDSHMPTPEEQEIERKQEVQRLALLHGGFSDIIDFENAIKEHGTDFHGAHGYVARSGDTTKDGQMNDSDNGEEDTYEREEDPMHRAIRMQLEKERGAKDGRIDSSRETDPAIVSATDSTAPSYPSLVSERKVFPAHEKDTTSESEHVKDEL